jgi:nitroreductase
MPSTSVLNALQSRYSCRAYLDKPVAAETLQRLLTNASISPSGTNLQPCKVHVVKGEKIQQLQQAVKAKFMDNIAGDGFDFRVYPENMSDALRQRRIDCGETLYNTLGIPRADRPARMKQTLKNSDFFGAPVGLIITVDPTITDGQLLDVGIMLQSIMLLAEEEGLSTCPQGFWTMWPNTIREVLGIDNELVAVGISVGYQDEDAIINTVRQSRLSFDEFVTIHE